MTPMSRPTAPPSPRRSRATSRPCWSATTSRSRPAQVLAKIDDRDFQVALDQANADLEAAKAAVVDQARRDHRPAVRHRRRAGDDRRRPGDPDLRRAGRQALRPARVERLRQRAERPAGGVARSPAARAAVARDNASLANATKQLDVLKAELAQAQAAVARDEALQNQAELNLSYTTITSAGRRRRRQPHAARRPVCAGGHAADGGGAAVGGLHRRQLQGDAARRRSSRPAGRDRGRHLSRRDLQRPRRQHRAGERPGIRAAAARQRHRQLHQGRAAHSGEDRARPDERLRRRAAPRHVGLSDHRDQGQRAVRTAAASVRRG